MGNKIDLKKAAISCSDYYDDTHLDYLNMYADELAKKPYDKQFLDRFISATAESGRILDIGCCSTAQQARYFHENGFGVVSIDLSKNCIETAKKQYPHIDFRQMDMTGMNFEDRSFDGINAFYSIIHIPDQQLDKLFEDFNRLLKINGTLAVTVHAGDFYGYYDTEDAPVFFRTYTQDQLKRYLDGYGFEILEMNQRQPIYDFEFQSERIYIIAKKIRL